MLCLGCGLGKTVVAIEMIARRRVRTLVIVHKEFLMNQWKERIEMFLPEARIGYLYQNKMEIEDKNEDQTITCPPSSCEDKEST